MTSQSGHAGSVDAWDEQYRGYQARLASRFLIPTLHGWGVDTNGARLLEVGCGDGGCCAEFARADCRVTALDMDERLVRLAREMNRREHVEFNVHTGDITRSDCPGLEEGPFDIVLLRDVVEHLEDLEGALRIVASNLRGDGVMFIVFPPYYSPYGAHQQILPRRGIGWLAWNKLPWIQLLPDFLFHRIVRGDEAPNREVARLRHIRLTLGKFEGCVRAAGLEIRQRRLYLSRPSFTLRYGLPVTGAGVVGRIPLLREILVTGGYFLVGKADGDGV